MTRVFVRFYTSPSVDRPIDSNDMDGLTERVASCTIEESTTWKDLRQMLEFEEYKRMYRKTIFNLELRHVMINACNPHGYSNHDLTRYAFATVPSSGLDGDKMEMCVDDLPTLISSETETTLIGETLLNFDLVLVPKSQIRPQDNKITSEKWTQETK
mmetsp:Transcript_26816/g.38477  ORF Transcript_26816/g.38477 Transcript_26816/m.38477 type:complete len:157 (-) Transcript_26816:2236-2706(-)